jgi:hypothetical protein
MQGVPATRQLFIGFDISEIPKEIADGLGAGPDFLRERKCVIDDSSSV